MLGCAYGRCAFCMYPAMEPTPMKLELCIATDSVAKKVQSINASVAIKNSLVTEEQCFIIASPSFSSFSSISLLCCQYHHSFSSLFGPLFSLFCFLLALLCIGSFVIFQLYIVVLDTWFIIDGFALLSRFTFLTLPFDTGSLFTIFRLFAVTVTSFDNGFFLWTRLPMVGIQLVDLLENHHLLSNMVPSMYFVFCEKTHLSPVWYIFSKFFTAPHFCHCQWKENHDNLQQLHSPWLWSWQLKCLSFLTGAHSKSFLSFLYCWTFLWQIIISWAHFTLASQPLLAPQWSQWIPHCHYSQGHC